MIADLKPYAEYKESGLPWLGRVPGHWETERAKWLFSKMQRPVRDGDEVITCFRDGIVTLRKNRRLRGFTEATVFPATKASGRATWSFTGWTHSLAPSAFLIAMGWAHRFTTFVSRKQE